MSLLCTSQSCGEKKGGKGKILSVWTAPVPCQVVSAEPSPTPVGDSSAESLCVKPASVKTRESCVAGT